jgi:hypothetical protein
MGFPLWFAADRPSIFWELALGPEWFVMFVPALIWAFLGLIALRLVFNQLKGFSIIKSDWETSGKRSPFSLYFVWRYASSLVLLCFSIGVALFVRWFIQLKK